MTVSSRVNVCDIQIDRYSFEEVVDLISSHIISNHNSPEYVVTPNAQHIVNLHKDSYFQNIYQQAFLVVPDGVPLLWAAKLFKTPLSSRVNGTDLFEKLCQVADEKNLKVFFLGGRPQAAQKAAQVLRERYKNLNVTGTYCPPFGFESDLKELDKINLLLKESAPDILFVGLGSPKQEYWIYQNYQRLNIPISIGIGVSFELVSGMVNRSPKWMQKMGLEWLFRLMMEPRRLWKRYILGNLVFLFLVFKHKLKLLVN